MIPQKLQESQSMMEILQGESSTSQDANTHLKMKIDRTLEALQIAGANAANARAEADASNARVESLTGQLNDLQSVIEDTKRGMEVVRREQDEVSRSARSIEKQYIHMESELVRAARVKKDAVEERDSLKRRAEMSEKLARELQDEVDNYRDEVRTMKKDLLEMEELERVRSDRTRSIEFEVKDARAGLLEATSAAAEAESTVTSLRSVVEELRSENECLHDRMNTSRDGHAKDRTKQNEALVLAEREAQKWKMKCEEGDEEIRKLTMDKTSADAEVAALKSRVATMERRLNDSSKQFSQLESTSSASSSVTPHTSTSLGFIDSFSANVPVVSDETKKRKIVADLPLRKYFPNTTLSASSRQLTYTYPRENLPNANVPDEHQIGASNYGAPTRKVAKTNSCCLCSKEGGMMLRCQCGDINCDMRGHAICIGKYRDFKKNDSGPTILCGRK
jgi:chromosome segregation ATPase